MGIESRSVDRDVMVPMRDGNRLATDIYYPADPGPAPVLLTRTPYGKQGVANSDMAAAWDLTRALEAGFIVVAQDVRGRFGSEGRFTPHFQEGDDGLDTIRWIEQQPWCDRSIGMFGGSYMGCSQWMVARYQPASLKAIAPSVAPIDMLGGGLFQGGVKTMHDLRWAVEAIGPEEMRYQIAAGMIPSESTWDLTLDQALPLLPPGNHQLIRQFAPFFDRNLAHSQDPDYWEPISPALWLDEVDVPALHIGGWYDAFLSSTLEGYRGLNTRTEPDLAGTRQRVVIGPWSHGNFTGHFPDRDFLPPDSATSIDLMGMQLRWFDYWLRGNPRALDADSPVTIFLMGEDRWLHLDAWPAENVRQKPLYLHSSGNAGLNAGDGHLSSLAPETEPPDDWQDNPLDPVPSVGGPVIFPGDNVDGPVLQLMGEQRTDVLVFTSEVLESPVIVCGDVDLVIHVSTSGRDADFTGKLIDVFPDGRAFNLTEGILRASWRKGLPTTPVEPDGIYELRLELWPTANTFAIGHRIRIEIASSNFPRFARNSHSGSSDPFEPASDYTTAINRLFHDSTHPTRLLLPLPDRASLISSSP